MHAVLVAALEIRIGRKARAEGEAPARLGIALESLGRIGPVLVEDAGADILGARRDGGEREEKKTRCGLLAQHGRPRR
jgi:hypothetical protein